MGSRLEQLLGGSPLAVFAKLLFLSLVVGAIMVGLGFSPATLWLRAVAALRSVLNLGADAFRDLGRTLLTGAVVVIPVWLALRLTRGRGRP